MKNKFIYVILLSVAFISCGKDEEPTCSVSDFVGTQKVTGGEACILNQANTLTITDAGSGKIKPVYTGGGVTSNFTNWTVSGCAFSGKVEETSLGLNVTVAGTLTDGKLTIKNTGTFLGGPVNCTENLTK